MHEPSSTPVGGEAYDMLDELYDAWCAEVAEDVPLYVSLVDALAAELGRASLDVVELGAGSGRITVPIAARGHRVRALDAASSQLGRCVAAAERAGVADRVCTMHADLRELGQLVAPGSADVVLAPFRTLLHVTPDRAAVLAAAFDVLRPGGVLAFDVFHPSDEQVGATHGRWLHRRVAPTQGGRWRFQERARYLPEDAAEPGGLKLEVDVRCRWRRSRRGRRIEALPLADPGPGDEHEVTALLELQLVPAERWHESLEQAGFDIDASYGWFDARPLEPYDDDSIWVARRPASGIA